MLLKRSIVFALTGIGVCAPAMAADMGYAPPPVYELNNESPVQIGNGWYLRGDVGWTRERPPALAPDAALSAALQEGSGWAAGLGAGYQFNSWFRGDLTLDYRNTLRASARSANFDCVTDVVGVNNGAGTPVGISAINGECYSQQKARFQRTSLLANAYLDLGNWSGITPYVGAGAGVTYGRASGVYNWYMSNDNSIYNPNIEYPDGFPPNWVTGTGDATTGPTGFTFGNQNKRVNVAGTKVNFTWALMAGIAVDLSRNAKVDFGYRFVNMGTFAPGAPKSDGQLHEYRIGFRYMPD